jgi:phosphoribosylaminoimidazole carboxylase (NCAIR synthetase)
MKKVLMLGGSLYQVYAIKEAVRLGYYVITCDYLPGNPGHKFAHEYYNVSTTDKEAVLELARSLKVDGVVAYASDPAAPTAAYVCEKLGLPTSPYASVEILSKKDLFRAYLAEHGFNVPKAQGFRSYEEAAAVIDSFQLPVMVKVSEFRVKYIYQKKFHQVNILLISLKLHFQMQFSFELLLNILILLKQHQFQLKILHSADTVI